MTHDEETAYLERLYGEAACCQPQSIREAVSQYNPSTLIEQIRWWERACEEERSRRVRAEKDRGWWMCMALAELLLLLAVAGARLL